MKENEYFLIVYARGEIITLFTIIVYALIIITNINIVIENFNSCVIDEIKAFCVW